MQITDVRVRRLSQKGNMRAVVSITFDDQFTVHDIKVIENDKGLFVAMPSRPSGNGEYQDIAHPINVETRRMLEEEILKHYREAVREQEKSGMS